MHLPLLFMNALLVGAQALIMIMELPLWWLWESELLAAVLVINGKAILKYFKKLTSFAKK
jgi:hypothetical protein